MFRCNSKSQHTHTHMCGKRKLLSESGIGGTLAYFTQKDTINCCLTQVQYCL